MVGLLISKPPKSAHAHALTRNSLQWQTGQLSASVSALVQQAANAAAQLCEAANRASALCLWDGECTGVSTLLDAAQGLIMELHTAVDDVLQQMQGGFHTDGSGGGGAAHVADS